MILLDTNLLGRVTDSLDPQCGTARGALHALSARGEKLVVFPQNLYEFWAVVTRRRGPPPGGQNGLGMTPRQAGQWLRFFRRRFVLLTDHNDLVDRWQALVEAHAVGGLRSHDTRLVAAMETHGVRRVLTFNGSDFRGFPGVTVVDPASV